jgi:CarD family transcriptional regulator
MWQNSKKQQFKVGDFVVHPVYGMGHIVQIEEKQFSEKVKRLTSERTGLRPVTAKNQLDQYRDLLKSRPVTLPKKYDQRRRELLSRLNQGSFQVVVEVVRDLTAWSWRKPLGAVDIATLQKTRENLYREWATAAGVTTTEAVKEIDTLLTANRQAYNMG